MSNNTQTAATTSMPSRSARRKNRDSIVFRMGAPGVSVVWQNKTFNLHNTDELGEVAKKVLFGE